MHWTLRAQFSLESYIVFCVYLDLDIEETSSYNLGPEGVPKSQNTVGYDSEWKKPDILTSKLFKITIMIDSFLTKLSHPFGVTSPRWPAYKCSSLGATCPGGNPCANLPVLWELSCGLSGSLGVIWEGSGELGVNWACGAGDLSAGMLGEEGSGWRRNTCFGGFFFSILCPSLLSLSHIWAFWSLLPSPALCPSFEYETASE